MKQALTISGLLAVIALSYLTAASQTPMFAEQLSFFGDRVDAVRQIASVNKSEELEKERATRQAAEREKEQAAKEAAATEEPTAQAESVPDEVDLDFLQDCFFAEIAQNGNCAPADLNDDGYVNAVDLGIFKGEQADPGITAEPVKLDFSANNDDITRGESVTLTWRAGNADTCTASEDWSGTKPLNGSETVSPTTDSVYRLTCSNDDNSDSQRVSVTVTDADPDPVPDPTFTPGDTIEVNTGNGSLLNVRATPNGSQVGQQPDGAYGDIVAGPTVAAANTWYNVNFDTGVDGWVAEDFLVAGERPDVATTCVAFAYTAWGSCQSDGSQTRDIAQSFPAGCEGGTPVLTQSCVYTPPTPGQGVGAVAPGHWMRVSNNTIADIDPENNPNYNPNYPNQAPWHGNLGQQGVFDAWTGGAFATGYGDEGALLAFGGGHKDYYGNEIYAFDIEKQLWELASVPSPYGTESCNDAIGGYPDGTPCPPHTYDYVEYLPDSNAFIVMATDRNNQGGNQSPTPYIYDFDTNEWQRMETAPYSYGTQAYSVYDVARKGIWIVPGSAGRLQFFDPYDGVDGSWESYQTTNVWGSTASYDPVRDLFVFFDTANSRMLAIDLADPNRPEVVLQTDGDDEIESKVKAGLEWNPDTNQFVVWEGNTTQIYTLTPPAGNWDTDTWTWNKITAPSTSETPGTIINGVYSKFRYVQSEGVFLVGTKLFGDVYAYRMPDSDAPSPDPDPDIDPTFIPGETIQVNTGDGSLLNVRSAPNGTVIGQQFDGAYGNVVLGPLSAASLMWYSVNFDSGADGWVAEDFLVEGERPGDDGDPDPVPTTAGNFEDRCADPDVVLCQGFEESIPIRDASSYALNGLMIGASTPQLDTNVKASGNSSLKFTIPSNSPANQGGSFWTEFSEDYSEQFGEGEEFWVQWRQRFDNEFIVHDYIGGGGWKQAIIGTGNRVGEPASSCTQLEIVTQNSYHRGFPGMYHSCGGKDGNYEPLANSVPPYDFDLQPGSNCMYTDITYGDQRPSPGCFVYTADEFLTFMVRVKVGTWYQNDGNYCTSPSRQAEAAARGINDACSTIELWAGREGEPLERVIYKPEYDLANPNDQADKYGKVWLLPYDTGKDASETHEETYTWYDDLIISRSRIADPE